MTTSNGSILSYPDAARDEVRLGLGEHPGEDYLDGAWWPRSRDLAVELADLVDNFPPASGRIVRALYSPPDWEPAARRIPVATGSIKVGSFPRDDTHSIDLAMADHTVLRLLVVPSTFNETQAAAAFGAAVAPKNSLTATAQLAAAGGSPDEAPAEHWTDDGGSWQDREGLNDDKAEESARRDA